MGFVLFVCFVPSIRHSSVSSVEILSQHLRHSDANKAEQTGPVLYKFRQSEQAGPGPYKTGTGGDSSLLAILLETLQPQTIRDDNNTAQ